MNTSDAATAKQTESATPDPSSGQGDSQANSAPQQAGESAKLNVVLAVLLAVIAFAVYWPNLTGALVYDDVPGITDNTSIRSLTDLKAVLSPPLETPVAGRPFTNLSLALDYAIWQYEPFGYKLHNLILHILAGWLLLGIFRRTFSLADMQTRFDINPAILAFAIALIWIVHPLYGEVVVYAIQRTEALGSLMMLLVFYAAIRGWSSSRPSPWLALAAIAHFVGLGSKEIVVTTLPLLLLYDRAFISGSFKAALSKHRWWYIAIASTLLLLIYTYRENPRGASTGLSHGVSMFENLVTQSNVLMYYIKSVLWPDQLFIINDWPIARHWLLGIPAGPIVLFLLGLTFYCLWRYPKAGFVGCWFFFILAPSSSIIPIPTEVASDRRMYLPSLAIISIVVLVAAWLIRLGMTRLGERRQTFTGVLLALAVVVAGTLAVRNVQHLSAFESELIFWETAVRADPGSKWAQEGYAILLARDDQYAVALKHGRLAALQMSQAPGIWTFLANVHYVLGDLEKAEYMQRRTFRVAMRHPEAARRLATFLRLIGKNDEAIEVLQSRMDAYPSARAYSLLGDILLQQGRFEESFEALKAAQKLDPYNADTLALLGALYNTTGRPNDAIGPLEQAVEFEPEHVGANQQLAAAYAETGRLEDAAAQFRRVLELDPDHPHARRNLADIENALRMGS